MADVNVTRGGLGSITERFKDWTGFFARIVSTIPLDSGGTELFTAANPGTVDSADIPTTVTEYNVTLTNADTEYSQALPATTRALSFRCRSPVEIRYAWTTGKVAGAADPYQTLQADAEYYKESIEMSSPTIYFASGTAGVVVEIEVWS